MFETPAKLLTSVIVGLGRPESQILQEAEAADVLYRKLAFYYESVRQAGQGLNVKKTSEFTLAAGVNTQNISTLTTSDAITPLWVERKIYNGPSNPAWEFVQTVNADTLAEKRELGEPAVAFYGETPNQLIAEFSFYGDEVGSPYNICRVWYAPANDFSANKDGTIAIPETVAAVVSVDTKLNCIPLMLANAAKYLDKQPQLADRMNAWREMQASLTVEKEEWLRHFNAWSKRSRGAHRAINHAEVIDLDRWF